MTYKRSPDPPSFEPSDSAQEHPISVRELHAALASWELFGRALPHELRTPLSLIGAFAALLQEREAQALSPRGRLWLDHVRAAALHANSLADALLELAPVSLQAIESVPVDLSALAAQIIELERAAAPERQAQVTIDPGLEAVGDPHLLRTLLANLLGNAWKYTSAKPQARIAFGRVHAADGEPAFCVRDNGVGFDMEHASKLFRPFERLHTRSEFRGVGLGLCIAQRAVERHGGRIWIEAAPEQGTRVFFRLGGGPGAPR
jgi:light-regulated signal transduction histidine kinase (bacteriophytochrome)